jgi:hypothetical protein
MKMGHAGMDGRLPGVQDASETSMSAWIPALHAGMTESRSRTKTDRDELKNSVSSVLSC